ncbi:hypothetical protein KM1_296330, partial [Entamoeba histolytica HM-3:IMSS]
RYDIEMNSINNDFNEERVSDNIQQNVKVISDTLQLKYFLKCV